MSGFKKYLIAGVVIVCGIAAVFMAHLQFSDNGPFAAYKGTWEENLNNDVAMFKGDVNIVELETKPGSIAKTMLLVYDEENWGFLCSVLNSEINNDMACSAVLLNENIDKSDLRVENYINKPITAIPMFLSRLEINEDTLEIKTMPLDFYDKYKEGNMEKFTLFTKLQRK